RRRRHMHLARRHHTAAPTGCARAVVSAGFGQTESGGPLKIVMLETAEGEGTPEHLRKGLLGEELTAACQERGFSVVDGTTVTEKGAMGYPSHFVEAMIVDASDAACPRGVPRDLGV